MAFKQVSILGLGFLGTSLGLALRHGPDAPHVVGYDPASASVQRAKRMGSVTQIAATAAEACSGSDCVILAAPVRAILELLCTIGPYLEPGSVVTDIGGTKEQIVQAAVGALPSPGRFVGGHPLAGPLTAGVLEPSPRLFAGTPYCLTPTAGTEPTAVDAVVQLVDRVGAHPRFLDAAEHDALLAAVSHLPYFVSAGLVRCVAAQSAWAEMSSMAAGGFRAATSLAGADPAVWADVAATNRDNIVRQLGSIIDQLTMLRDLIAAGESPIEELRQAHVAHQEWLQSHGASAPSPPTAQSNSNRGPRWVERLRL